jgi:hypothetical protein
VIAMKRISVILSAITLSGCAAITSTSTVTWRPDIAGATIVEQGTGRIIGFNVAAMNYQPRAEHVSQPGCFDIRGVIAKWPSGHESATEQVIRLCQGYRSDYYVNIPYQGSDAQREIDIPYAIEYNIALNQQQAIQAAERDRLVAATINAVTANAIAINQVSTGTQNYSVQSTGTTPSFQQATGCSNDYQCGTGMKCIKAPLSSTGVCLKPVNEFGFPQQTTPDPNSVFPNMNLSGQCQFDTDCSIGFKCDRKLKVCTK